MKTLILLLACILPCMLNAQKRELSMKKAKGEYVNGKYLYLDQEDQPFSGILYAKYPNGNFISRQNFENGLGNGTWTNYYENGNIKEVGTYDNNKVKGPIKKYNKQGAMIAEGTYDEWRVRVGQWTYYDSKGYIVRIEDYGKKGDYRDVEAYYNTGQISKMWYDDIMKRKEVFVD